MSTDHNTQPTETLKKYLAGLNDADGNLCFVFYKTKAGFKVTLKWALVTANSIDKDFQCIKSLHEAFGLGTILFLAQRETWAPTALWQIQRVGELEKFIPHIAKYSVIKGRHYMRLLEKRRELAGKILSVEEIAELKKWAKQSRTDSGPLKPNNFPSSAWLAGMIDGDGSLVCKYQAQKKYWRMRFTLALHNQDYPCLSFIQKAFGGEIYQHGNKNVSRIELNLGFSKSSGAMKFLHYVYPNLRMKKHCAQILLTAHKQRLSERTSTEEATV